MTPSIRPVIAALLVAVCSANTVNAQASPPPRPQEVAPALLPPPNASPKPETVAPRTSALIQVGPQATESAVRLAPAPLRPASAPVESVRPAASATQAPPSMQEVPNVDPPPPAPGTRQPVQSAVEPTAVPDGPPPAGATARCKDGSYLFTPTAEQSCVDRGGLVVLFAPRPAAPTPPRRP